MAGTYTLTVTGAGGCVSAPVSTTVVVNALPVATAASNSPVCEGSPLNLTGGPAGMTTYAWTGPNGFTSAPRARLSLQPLLLLWPELTPLLSPAPAVVLALLLPLLWWLISACRYCCFQQPCLRRFSAQSYRRACRYDYICLDRT